MVVTVLRGEVDEEVVVTLLSVLVPLSTEGKSSSTYHAAAAMQPNLRISR